MNKSDTLKQLDAMASGDVVQGHLTDRQYAEIIALANRVHDMDELSRLDSAKMTIALYEKLDRKNATAPRDAARKVEDSVLSNYNKVVAKGIAVWKMTLNSPPSNDEIIAKTAKLDKEYRDNLAVKSENAAKRSEFAKSM